MANNINLEQEKKYTLEVTLSGESIAVLMSVLQNMPYKQSAECIEALTQQLHKITEK
jgi:hypothetical protein